MMCGSASANFWDWFWWGDRESDRRQDDNVFETQRSRGPFQFALIGDVPYGERAIEQFPALVEDINNDRRNRWVMHAGDIKAGSTMCDDLHLFKKFFMFEKFDRPFIYTPGDNEWTDCHRENNGGFHPLDRLELIRALFFPRPGLTTGGQRMRVTTQADDPGYELYVENVAWVRGGVVFATIHMVGSSDGFSPWSQGTAGDPSNPEPFDPLDSRDMPREDRIMEVIERREAGMAWLAKVFEVANDIDSPGVFIMIHADPQFLEVGSANAPSANQIEAYGPFIEALADEVNYFDGEVVLAHGDTHFFRVDKLLRNRDPDDLEFFGGPRLENFTRVETFGSTENHWVRVKVNPKGPVRGSPGVFTFEPVIVEENQYPRIP